MGGQTYEVQVFQFKKQPFEIHLQAPNDPTFKPSNQKPF
jgi:hypothetical protein